MLARASVLASFDLGGADLDLAGFGGVSRLLEAAVPAGDDASYAVFDYEMQGVVAVGGAAVGVSVPIAKGVVRPGIEWMRYASRIDASAAAPAFRPENVVTFTLSWQQSR
jgi:hypothetical protein